VTRLAVHAGLSPRVVGDLDEDEYHALVRAVTEHDQERAWSNREELLAGAVEVLGAIHNQLAAGVRTVMVKDIGKPEEVQSVPRPPWVKERRDADGSSTDDEEGVIVVKHVRDALTLIRGGQEGGVPVNV
jgi:hypothetical protein